MTRLLFQLVGTLVLTAWILHWLPYIVVTVLLCGGGYLVARDIQRRREAKDALRGRAEQQHNWVMAGDLRGIYGEYPPATT